LIQRLQANWAKEGLRDVFPQFCVRQAPLKSLDQFYRQGCKFKGAYKVDKNIPSDINTLKNTAAQCEISYHFSNLNWKFLKSS